MRTLISQKKTAREISLQIKQARAALRGLHETLEDLEDRLILAEARAKNAGKPGIPWEIAAKELGIRLPKRKARS